MTLDIELDDDAECADCDCMDDAESVCASSLGGYEGVLTRDERVYPGDLFQAFDECGEALCQPVDAVADVLERVGLDGYLRLDLDLR